MRWIFLVTLLILIGCQDIELIENNTTRPGVQAPEGRPDIPRTNPPSNMEDDFIPAPEPTNRTPVFIPVGPAGVDLDVPLGDAIGEHHELLTQREFKLLRHSPMRISANELVGYDETIRFDFGVNSTGKMIFGQDDDQIGTFLLFEEDKPILEYRLQLKGGTFEHYSGREIQVLGHTYVIAEASNRSVALYGKSVASNLFFDDGEPLLVNSTQQSDTEAKVTQNTLSFILYTDGPDKGDILLSPQESLGDNLDRLVFGTDLMDIRYKGAPELDASRIELRQLEDGYVLSAQTKNGMITFDLVTVNGGFRLGGEEGLRMPPCGYCIMQGDNFLVTTPAGTRLLRFSSVSVRPNQLVIRDGDTRHSFEYRGTPGVNASTNIIIDEYSVPVRIGARDNETGKYNISIEQGLRSNEITLANGALLRIGQINASVLQLQLILPAAKTVDRREQVTNINITSDLQIVVGNMTFFRDDEDTFGMTPYGTLIHLERYDRRLPDNVGDDAVILVPAEPLYGVVMVEE